MSLYTVLTCPTCGGKTNLSTDTRTATCEYCGNQLLINPPASGAPAVEARSASRQAIVPKASGVTIQNTPGGVEISRRWFHPRYIFMAFFCVIWDVFLLFWYGAAFSMRGPAIMFLFPLIHLTVGAVLTYTTLAGFVNTSYITLNRQEVSVRHAPLPYPGNKAIPAADVRQLYTQEIVRQTKNGATTSYNLSAVTRDGEKLDLLKGLDSPEAGLYIEQQIEQYYNITDQPVAGEMPR